MPAPTYESLQAALAPALPPEAAAAAPTGQPTAPADPRADAGQSTTDTSADTLADPPGGTAPQDTPGTSALANTPLNTARRSSPAVVVASLPGGRELGALRDWETDAALAVGTSGSTGEPKVVLLSAAALAASAVATHERLGGAGSWLLALPTTHIAGIQVLVRSAVAGREPVAVDLSSGFRATGFAAAARTLLRRPGRHYTALVPTQLSRLVAADGPGLAAAREFDAILLGGAAAPPALLTRAREAGVRVVTTYGMSETAGGCVYDGVPLDGVHVRLAEGRIELAGPVLALGYQGGERFGEWFRTGDLGRFVDGRLVVLGRADDVIISGGENIAPVEVERVLAAQVGVHEVCVVGLPDPEWGQVVAAAVVPVDPSLPPDVAELAEAVRVAVGRYAVPKHVVFVPELPSRGPGKVDRREVARSFE
ncbi:o-succinylbenzoate--CoA ligase [Saccharothrix obliqua]|uniref:o-succinylbenzoate--CoA ligase n=1 Tax=Saccharothrix obliqua TaxID=2861747 RepID=UPI002151C67B|nr:o-succinylbenzoate--CoA ligase [Saccharothrix obliqua]